MANMLISQMGLPQSIANIFAARNISTAKDALSLTEFELMALLDVDLAHVKSAVSRISEVVCPPCLTALMLMEDGTRNERSTARLPTLLKGLDEALCGGIPFGSLTEVVGPAGIGKTQFCLKLSLLAALPVAYGGSGGRVLYVDTESKFNPQRLMEIGKHSFPHVFQSDGVLKEMAGRIVVSRPSSLNEFTESMQQIKLSLLRHEIKLIIIDSVAALFSGENDRNMRGSRQQMLGWPLSYLKSVAELSRTPIVVTNQVRGQTSDEAFLYSFQGQRRDANKDSEKFQSHLVAALGIQWAHAVTIRLVLEAHSDQRFIKVAKSPISPPLAFPFVVTSSGILLLSDDGITVSGTEINAIRCQEITFQ